MTSQDRARLAQIVAWGLSRGDSEATIESRLLEYTSGLPQAEIDEAFYRGRVSLDLAGMLQTGDAERAAQQMAQFGPVESQTFRILYRVRIGAGPDDWRSGAVTVGAGASPGTVMAQAQQDANRLIDRITKDEYETRQGVIGPQFVDRQAADFGRVEFIYATPE